MNETVTMFEILFILDRDLSAFSRIWTHYDMQKYVLYINER